MPRRRWLAYLGAAAGILVAAGVGCRVLFPSGPATGRPEVILEGEGSLAGGVQVGDDVIVATVAVDGEKRVTYLTRYDEATGELRQRRKLADAPAMADLVAFDELLVLRLTERVPRVEAVLPWWPPDTAAENLESTEVWLVVVDESTLEPVRQYRLAPVRPPAGPYEPLILIDGTIWFLNSGVGEGRVDLRSGAIETVSDGFGYPGIVDVGRDDDELIVARLGSVRVYEVETGEATWHPYEGPHWARPLGGYRYHDSQVWIGGSGPDDLFSYYRYDLQTKERSDPVPWSALPIWSFESGGFRWELFNPDGTPVRHPSSDVWRQVAIETGATVAERDFDDLIPRFASEGFVWLEHRPGNGPAYVLVRLPLG